LQSSNASLTDETCIELKTKVTNVVLSVLSGGLPKATVNPEVIGKNNQKKKLLK